MSNRGYPSQPSRSSFSSPRVHKRERDSDRDTPRGDDRHPRGGRSRSRSPKRERQEDRERGTERDRLPRDYDRSTRGGYRGGRERDHGAERNNPRRAGYREDERDGRDRPLDRRAIEEGRRRREEERANGVVYADEPKSVPTGPKRGVTAQREDQGMGSASPRPESFGDEEMTGQKRRIRGDKSLVDGEGEGMEDGGSDDDDGEEGIATMMGFGGFGTTKGKGNGSNADGAIKVHKQRTWRQYMNRRGGFNRPLEKMK
ncbi:MAG: hypothetical protein TREMPRED_001855 [Tremellales sp. Tagirdzhanova-0007]|nr:MAG: hypothetical protein TREMPRED_001855 [Tremellales sp. Tagirdzhanova-0007]